ncbi:MAG: glycerol-3-phosphate dehydrogenase [Chloroflexota bacterium]|nr:MAG: glycerol-3-phosphate dehydrogenase [Chloroflexota bacterium]
MRIAVLGTGNGGMAAAGHLALEGHEIRLWGRTRANFAALLLEQGAGSGRGRLEVKSIEHSGDAEIALVTDDIAKALDGAELILVPAPAYSHDDIALAFAPHVREGQVVTFMPGNFSSVSARRILDAAGAPPIPLLGTATLPYGARRSPGREVVIALRTAINPAAALPASRNSEAVAVLKRAYPEVVEASDVLDVALLNPNLPIHSSLMVTNAGPIEHFGEEYDMHADGTTPATLRVIYSIDRERIAVREALGYGAPHYEQETYYDKSRQGEGLFGRAASTLVEESGLWRERLSMDHRYLDEDIAYGVSLISEAGRVAGVPTPTTDSLIQVASVLRGLELRGRGRNLAMLGLNGLSPEQLRAKLR